MGSLGDMIWIEVRKAIRSRMPFWTTLGALFMPLGVGVLIFLARNPAISQKLGLVSAKANLVAYSATDWPAYLVLFNEIIAAGGFFFFIVAISWTFGREFADGTLKDLLALPVPRSNIILAKFITVVLWSGAMAVVMLAFGLILGAIIHLPGGSRTIILQGIVDAGVTAGLVMVVVLPFGFFASFGRGYILPLVLSVLTLITANFLMAVGLAEYFPWAVPLLYTLGESPLKSISYWIVLIAGLAGIMGTYLWWKYADQSR